MQINLDDYEVQMIEQHRKKKEKAEITKALQELCSHPNWEYDGHGHNDTCYKCIDCGILEWR